MDKKGRFRSATNYSKKEFFGVPQALKRELL
jgi:hypothetical protein